MILDNAMCIRTDMSVASGSDVVTTKKLCKILLKME